MSVPHLIFISPKPRRDNDQSLCEAWQQAAQKYFGEESSTHFSIYEGYLREIDAALLKCDCMVSPANSFGIMDGGYVYTIGFSLGALHNRGRGALTIGAISRYDLELSRVLMGESQDPWRLTHRVQEVLRARWRGFAPPATCTLVELPADAAGAGNAWAARVLAVVPTMRVPDDVDWHKDLCYNSMWGLLAEVAQWNASHSEEEQIRRVLMTGLGTGVGRMSVERCAAQMVLAVKHFRQGWPDEPTWKDVYPAATEVDQTTTL